METLIGEKGSEINLYNKHSLVYCAFSGNLPLEALPPTHPAPQHLPLSLSKEGVEGDGLGHFKELLTFPG